MTARPAALTRAGLVLVATGVLSFVSVRGYLDEDAATARDLTFGFAAFFTLVLLASGRTPPRWSALFALVLTAAAYLWGTTLVGGQDWSVVLLLAAMALGFRLAEPPYRSLIVAGFALWTPALWLFAARGLLARVEPAVAVAAWGALLLVLVTTLIRHGHPELRLRRVGLAILAVACVSAVFERHDVVASSILAPDDAMAVLSVIALGALAVVRLPTRVVDSFASGIALATYVLVAMALLLGKGYHVDAVTAPHYSAILLLQGKDPYVSFDMTASLAHFGLPQTLATKLEDGTYLHSFNYPALSFLVVTPFVALGLTDMRWVYLGEMLVIALLFIGRARVPWRPLVAGLIVGSTVLTRQYVLAGIDPTWALGVSIAWLFVERRWLSPLALGLATASRQPAWFFVPFYLLAMWRLHGRREALRRGVVAGAGFALPNLPFVLDAPAAWFTSVLAPMAGPLEPYGVGIVRLGILGPLPLLPRAVYTVLGVVALVLLLALLWRRWRRLPNGALTFPLVPLFFAWRSLQNYFVFLPLLAILHDEDLVAGGDVAVTSPLVPAPSRAVPFTAEEEVTDAGRQGAARDPGVPR